MSRQGTPSTINRGKGKPLREKVRPIIVLINQVEPLKEEQDGKYSKEAVAAADKGKQSHPVTLRTELGFFEDLFGEDEDETMLEALHARCPKDFEIEMADRAERRLKLLERLHTNELIKKGQENLKKRKLEEEAKKNPGAKGIS